MPDSGENLRFELLINGESKGIASLESFGVLSLTVDWVARDPAKIPQDVHSDPSFREKEWLARVAGLRLGGLDSVRGEMVDWVAVQLDAGDEIALRVLPPGAFDAAPHRRKSECG